MRYMCLVHFEHSKLDGLPLAEKQDVDRRSMAYDQELFERGNLVMAQAVQGGDSAVLVRVRNGKVSATDGPFIETKEQMAGFVLIEARDMNEAVRIASAIPLAEIGTIEIRPEYIIPPPPL
ncbi:MAG: YciI family protein [Devosia sp.]